MRIASSCYVLRVGGARDEVLACVRRCKMVRVFYFCVPLPHVRYCAYRFNQPLDNCDELDAKSQNRNDRLDFFLSVARLRLVSAGCPAWARMVLKKMLIGTLGPREEFLRVAKGRAAKNSVLASGAKHTRG